MGYGHGDSVNERWTRLDNFLRTSPSDPGCATCRLDIDTYAELTIRGRTPTALLPGVAAHLEACADCQEDLKGLIAALSQTLD